MDLRVAGNVPSEPFLGKRLEDSIRAQTGLDVHESVAGVVRCTRSGVGRQRVALHEHEVGLTAQNGSAQFEAQVLMRCCQMP